MDLNKHAPIARNAESSSPLRAEGSRPRSTGGGTAAGSRGLSPGRSARNRMYLVCKRTTDLILSGFGLAMTIPFLPLVALLIKLDSRGPVFYAAARVGKDMKPFSMYKLRTMIDTPIEVGESISPHHDPRVTAFGRFLRRTKLNEFPQLLNILKGEMSFVGPRPESPDLAEMYPDAAREIFAVTPGLVGPNQILGRNEEELFPPGCDVKQFYIENILPRKVAADLKYIGNPGLFKDLVYIFWGVKETLVGALSKSHIQDNRSQLYLLAADLGLSAVSFCLAYGAYFCIFSHRPLACHPVVLLPAVLAVRVCFFVMAGMYHSLIRFISFSDIRAVGKGVSAGSLSFVILVFFAGLHGLSRLLVIFDWLLLFSLLAGLRFGLRLYWERRHRPDQGRERRRVLIYGAGRTGYSAYRLLTADSDSSVEVVGFLDDARATYGKMINGCRVLGDRHHIKALVRLYKVHEILLAVGDVRARDLNRIIESCRQAGVGYKVFSSPSENPAAYQFNLPLRMAELADVLSLKRIKLDFAAVRGLLADKTVLLHGSGGALGLELCCRLLSLGCGRLIIVDQYESYLTQRAGQLYSISAPERIVPVLVGPDKTAVLKQVFAQYRPEVVIEAGLKKYVPPVITTGGADSDEMVRSNHRSSLDLARLALECGSSFYLVISSFAAGGNGNRMAASLLSIEQSLRALFAGRGCRLIITRICDVVENHGGPISIMESQIRGKGAVTIPSPDAVAYIISKQSGANFILQSMLDATRRPADQCLFVCEAGSPLAFSDIAERLANLHGLELGNRLVVRAVNVAAA